MNRPFYPLLLFFLAWICLGSARAGVPPQLRQDAYVWQRAWNEAVVDSVKQHGTNFSELIVLAAEVTWKQGAGKPSVVRPPIDFAALRGSTHSVGLALRIGPFPGPFSANDERANLLAGLAGSLIAAARSNFVEIAELQIDFDCAESKLVGYRLWVEAIRRGVTPVPISITALPVWLKHPAFKMLAESAGGYVLQVHSLERPADISTVFALCNVAQARKAVEMAVRIGIPFRVALPTYGYLVAFDRGGKFVGLSAEGPSMTWPDGFQMRDVRADPEALAGLIADWQASIDRPPSLVGVIWYRLPILDEHLNWPWPTLTQVMSGIVPCPNLCSAIRQPEPALAELELVNDGSADCPPGVKVTVHWNAGRLVAYDSLLGFEAEDSGKNQLSFHSDTVRLGAGQRRMIGWVRLDQAADLNISIQLDQTTH